jgi:hypothetical protein
MSGYFRNTWLNKIAFWSRGIVSLLETANGMQIEDSNQFMEGVIGNAKTNQDAKAHVSEPAEYMLHCWDDSQKMAKNFISQIETLHGRMEGLEEHRSKKHRALLTVADAAVDAPSTGTSSLPVSCATHAVGASDEAALTQDMLTQQEEDTAGETWTKGTREEIERRLRGELNDIFLENGVERGNTTRQRLFILNSGIDEQMAGNIPSYPTFDLFMTNRHKASKGLSKKHFAALVKSVNTAKQGEGVSRGATSEATNNVEV